MYLLVCSITSIESLAGFRVLFDFVGARGVFSSIRVVQNAPKPPPEVQGGPGQTLGASKKCVPTENPEERVA